MRVDSASSPEAVGEIELRCLTHELAKPTVVRRADIGECDRRCLAGKPCPICAARKNGDPVISGYAAVWGSESRDLGGFVETVSQGSFADVIARSLAGAGDNIAGLYNHDKNVVLGRHSSGTLKLTEDKIGLRYLAAPPKHNWWVAELVDRGDVTGSSFSFANARKHEQWSPRSASGLPRRNLVGFSRVIDVGPVLFPAFGGTEGHVASRALEVARNLSTRTTVAFPKALAFVGWARERGLTGKSSVSRRSLNPCGQVQGGLFGAGNTCAKGSGGSSAPADMKRGPAGDPSERRPAKGEKCCTEEQLSAFAAKYDHGSTPDRDLKGAVRPLDVSPIREKLIRDAAEISKRIGVDDSIGSDIIQETNSAGTLVELWKDAKATAPSFAKMVRAAAAAAGSHAKADFGPDDIHILKKPHKISAKIPRKIQDNLDKQVAKGVASPVMMTRMQVLKKFDDAVRGSLITDTPEQLGVAIKKFKQLVESSGGKVEIDNKWNNNVNPSGYVAVHARVLMKTPQGRNLFAELQFHLRGIYDGEKKNPKNDSHHVYEIVRDNEVPRPIKAKGDDAMSLIYALAVDNILSQERTGR